MKKEKLQQLNINILKEIVADYTIRNIEDLYGIVEIYNLDSKQLVLIPEKDCRKSGLLYDLMELQDEKTGFVVKKNYDVKYSSEKEEILLEEHAPVIVNALNIFLKDKVTKIWFDFGSSMYDLHIEFSNLSDGDSVDLYLNVENKQLMGQYNYRGLAFSKVVGDEIVAILIAAIEEVKK